MMRFLLAFLLVIVAVEAKDVVSPVEVYWHSILPNTSMPPAIRQLIHPGVKSNRVTVLCNRLQYVYIMSHFNPSIPPADILSTFFPKKNLHPGAELKGISLNKTIVGNVFVPRSEADAVPFSSKNLPNILQHFSMVSGSEAANQMEMTLNYCETPTLKGEKRFCSTSLESMVDNVVSLLGSTRNIHAVSTTINGSRNENTVFKVASPMKEFSNQEKLVICHPLPSPQAVHYCHANNAYKGYVVSLLRKDGAMVNAVAVCHHDVMNFDRFFLEVLKQKPGAIEPICHFLPENHILWVG